MNRYEMCQMETAKAGTDRRIHYFYANITQFAILPFQLFPFYFIIFYNHVHGGRHQGFK